MFLPNSKITIQTIAEIKKHPSSSKDYQYYENLHRQFAEWTRIQSPSCGAGYRLVGAKRVR